MNPRSLSYWHDSLAELGSDTLLPSGQLDGSTSSDVVIVGAGFTGLWTAYYLALADPSLQIRIVEAEIAGFGASGRNGGWCSALFPWSPPRLATEYGQPTALAMSRAMQQTVIEVGRVALAEGIECDWALGGTVVAARTPLQLQGAREEVAAYQAVGLGEADLALLDAKTAQAMIGASNVMGGTYTPHCAAIHPAKLVRGLADVVRRRGVMLHEATTVMSLEPGIVRTNRGDVRAPIVIRATEGYTPNLPGAKRDIVPVYSLMLATEPLPEAFWQLAGLSQRETFSDFRNLIIYGQRTADNRLAFGGRGAPYHWKSTIKAEYDHVPAVYEELRRVLVELFAAPFAAAFGLPSGHVRPADVPVSHTWGGPLGISRDWCASVRYNARSGLGSAGGYVGDGVGTTNLAGRTLTDLILGRNTDLVALPWAGHRSPRWEVEPLRWLGANAGLKAMSIADRSEARTGKASKIAAAMGRLTGH